MENSLKGQVLPSETGLSVWDWGLCIFKKTSLSWGYRLLAECLLSMYKGPGFHPQHWQTTTKTNILVLHRDALSLEVGTKMHWIGL